MSCDLCAGGGSCLFCKKQERAQHSKTKYASVCQWLTNTALILTATLCGTGGSETWDVTYPKAQSCSGTEPGLRAGLPTVSSPPEQVEQSRSASLNGWSGVSVLAWRLHGCFLLPWYFLTKMAGSKGTPLTFPGPRRAISQRSYEQLFSPYLQLPNPGSFDITTLILSSWKNSKLYSDTPCAVQGSSLQHCVTKKL